MAAVVVMVGCNSVADVPVAVLLPQTDNSCGYANLRYAFGELQGNSSVELAFDGPETFTMQTHGCEDPGGPVLSGLARGRAGFFAHVEALATGEYRVVIRVLDAAGGELIRNDSDIAITAGSKIELLLGRESFAWIQGSASIDSRANGQSCGDAMPAGSSRSIELTFAGEATPIRTDALACDAGVTVLSALPAGPILVRDHWLAGSGATCFTGEGTAEASPGVIGAAPIDMTATGTAGCP